MPIEITGPDGKVHSFADGTTSEQINAAMSARYAAPAAPAAPQGPALGESYGQMPAGTYPGRMTAQPTAPDASMVPLSDEAQKAIKALRYNQFKGDRAGVSAANDILLRDPTYQARAAQAKKMGEDAASLQAKQAAGARVLQAFNEMTRKVEAWREYAPDLFNAATGPWNSNETFQSATGWANRGAQDLNTMLHHDIGRLVALYREMPSSGKGTGSDAQDANFQNAIGHWMKSPSPEGAMAILQSAKNLIKDKGGLPYEFDTEARPLDVKDIAAINKYAKRKIDAKSKYAKPDYFDERGQLRIGQSHERENPPMPAQPIRQWAEATEGTDKGKRVLLEWNGKRWVKAQE